MLRSGTWARYLLTLITCLALLSGCALPPNGLPMARPQIPGAGDATVPDASTNQAVIEEPAPTFGGSLVQYGGG